MTSLTTRATPERLYRLLADNATDVITLLDAEGRPWVAYQPYYRLLSRPLPAAELEALLHGSR